MLKRERCCGDPIVCLSCWGLKLFLMLELVRGLCIIAVRNLMHASQSNKFARSIGFLYSTLIR